MSTSTLLQRRQSILKWLYQIQRQEADSEVILSAFNVSKPNYGQDLPDF
jgi:hypothetical protein